MNRDELKKINDLAAQMDKLEQVRTELGIFTSNTKLPCIEISAPGGLGIMITNPHIIQHLIENLDAMLESEIDALELDLETKGVTFNSPAKKEE